MTFYFHKIITYNIKNKEEIKGNIHTSMTNDYKKVVWLFDQSNVYQFDVASETINKVYKEENVQSI